MSQRFNWPRDANGNYLPVDQFPALTGIPQSMYDYLVANPDADPTGLLRAQGVGGPPVRLYVRAPRFEYVSQPLPVLIVVDKHHLEVVHARTVVRLGG